MANIFAEKRPESSSRAFANQTDGKNGKSMPAVPALQKQGAPAEEEPAIMKAAQLKDDTLQKAGLKDEELPAAQTKAIAQKEAAPDEDPALMKSAQLKNDTVQKQGPEEEEKPAMMKIAQLENGMVQKQGPEEEEKPAMMKIAQLRSDPAQKKSADENKTGLPDNLKAGVEQLSGYSLNDVKVHYNSSKPAQLNALAYAQGTDIHVAPGQEKHLPHEAWHVAQQKQGRVQPTTQTKGVAVNDDKGLESEADTMGAKAIQMKTGNTHGKGCGCSSCCAKQLKTDNNLKAITQRVVANVAVDTPGAVTSKAPGKVAQLTDATVYVNNANRGTGHCDIGEGTGGESHAEQIAWTAAKSNVDAKFSNKDVNKVVVNFTVDQKICTDCQDWFETTLYTYLKGKSDANDEKEFELLVEVDGLTVNVHGAGETDWPGEVGDEERGFLTEDLKNTLLETGGLSETKIMVYDETGETTEYEYHTPEQFEELLTEKRFEIKASKENWKKFQETGMTLVGERAEIDFKAVHDENEANFDSERRAARRRH